MNVMDVMDVIYDKMEFLNFEQDGIEIGINKMINKLYTNII